MQLAAEAAVAAVFGGERNLRESRCVVHPAAERRLSDIATGLIFQLAVFRCLISMIQIFES